MANFLFTPYICTKLVVIYYVTCNFLIVFFYRFSNFSRRFITCLFVTVTVFITCLFVTVTVFITCLFVTVTVFITCLFVTVTVLIVSNTPIHFPHNLLIIMFLIASFEFLPGAFPCLFPGKKSINRFHMIIVPAFYLCLILSMLLKSIFPQYFLISIYLFLWKFLMYRFLS